MNIEEYLEKQIQKADREKSIKLYLAGIIIEVLSNSNGIIDGLRDYFCVFIASGGENADITIHAIEDKPQKLNLDYTLKKRPPGKKPKEEFIDTDGIRVVRKIRTDMLILFDKNRNLIIGPASKNLNQVVNFINNRFIERKINEGHILLHAAANFNGSNSIAICGFSGMGKSTLALHLMSRGAGFISNDRLLLKKTGKAHPIYGVPKFPRINPGTIVHNEDLHDILDDEDIEAFLEMPKSKLWDHEEKYDAFIDKIFGKGKFQLEADCDALVILNWHISKGKTKISKVVLEEREALFPAFMKNPGLFFMSKTSQMPDFSKERYLRYLEGMDIFEITGSIDFDKAADYFWQYLNFLDEND
ncbi:MAG: HprK-related kinase B [Candidatus Zixiibacteriota bacterium]